MLGSFRSVAGALVVATGLGAVGFSPSVARADHKSYEYSGPQHGFHGETHLVDALRYLEVAYYAGYEAHRPIRKARTSILDAMLEICSRRARSLLRDALEHVSEFRFTGELSNLDAAAYLVTEALAIERKTHVIVRPPVIKPPCKTGHKHFPGCGHAFGNPGFGNPGFGKPGFGKPGYGKPGYGKPGFGKPGFGKPGFGGNPGFGYKNGGGVKISPNGVGVSLGRGKGRFFVRF